MQDISIVLVTTGSEEEAAKLGRTLVEEKLAACANIIPRIRSIYSWKGEVYDEQESLMLIKSRTPLFAALKSRIRELHSYEVPEIIAFPISQGLHEYLDWVVAETRQA